MKLNSEIESYDVASLTGIDTGLSQMKRQCQKLTELGVFLKKKIVKARADGFQDVNTDRAEKIIDEYLKKLEVAGAEYSELSESVKEFINKINDIWSPWR